MGNLVLGPETDSFYGRPGLSGPGPFAPSDMTTSHSGFGHAAAPGLSSYGSLPAAPVRNDLLQWAFLSDDTMWNVVGEYVYGDPNETLELFNGFDFGLS
ncbi:hypothetical protein CMQ_6780 [Grosmannia clavigera kw1407]|uniref:Uncharacterized protein n=1 Tax=Grosmannia clavigera (strain kw1407 / UAMH 11150) TaxID=655863 RepID=F0X6K3_GROCL|nr:uncharacterized protein CMQ_6780 [Grosmannia clavigera kw1407]EFX06459.1 hypothetical protein CMQ_6780 [Grosmannia clavigera kw1407]